MIERRTIVGSPVGLHARPASLLVQAVSASGLPVQIALEGGNPVNARSILAVMGLGAKQGDVVVLTVDGGEGEAALDDLATLVSSDLDAV